MGVIFMLYHRDFVERMREQYPPGTRVEVVSLCNEEEHLKPGMKGTVVAVDDQPALLVDWDNGSSLGQPAFSWRKLRLCITPSAT